jgi:hypothetical protein
LVVTDPSINRAAILIGLFGGVSRLSADTDLDPATVSRWASFGPRGGNGRVPPQFNAVIMDAGRRRGIAPNKIKACLETDACPCCRQKMPASVDRRFSHLPNEIRKYVTGRG